MDATALARRLLEPVPANATLGLEILHAVDGDASVALTVVPRLTNLVGSLHASGLVGLVDAAGLTAVVAACEDEAQARTLVPLGSSTTTDFLTPARGRLIASCSLSDAARQALGQLLGGRTERTCLSTEAVIVDEAGDTVCRGSFRWRIRTYARAHQHVAGPGPGPGP
jgi:uncharacterized protein (TIGR00369 family)